MENDMARIKKTKAEKVWAYLLKHPTAKPVNVAKACGCTSKYVYTLKSKIGTPKEVFEAEAKAKVRVRSTILHEAESLVSSDREREHGDFYSNAYLTAKLWYGYTGYDIQPEQVPVMLALLKVARSSNSNNMDNFRDAAGYMALAAELNS